jgi:hypothetical protein
MRESLKEDVGCRGTVSFYVGAGILLEISVEPDGNVQKSVEVTSRQQMQQRHAADPALS